MSNPDPPYKSHWLKSEINGVLLVLVTINAVELLRLFSLDLIDPFPFLLVVVVYAAFTSYGVISLLIVLIYLCFCFFSTNLTPGSFYSYLITFPFLVVLVNLIKFSLQSEFNPQLELNFEKIKVRRDMEKMKREFISMAAHQLRTPLGGIRWDLERILTNSNQLDSKLKEKITEIYSSNLRMISLVNDLLTINKLLAGKAPQEVEVVDLNQTINSLLKDVQYLTQQNEVKLRFDATNSELKIAFNTKALHEVLLNLITNAIKYSKLGSEVRIVIAVTKTDIVISVADQGIGIAKEDYPNIFERFYRAKNAIAISSEGNGLGLYLVKLLVEDWGGKVWYNSYLNQGTTFYFTIPKRRS